MNKVVASILGAGTVAVLVAGCGVGQGSSIEIEPGQAIKVGVIPVADFAPVYIAMDKGYFDDEGLRVEAQVMQNAAAIAPSVLNGQLQFGTAAASPFLTAVSKGLPLVAVANEANVGTSDADDASGLVVSSGSPVDRPRDLEGRTVAVNALNSIVHVAAAQSIRSDGGDPAKVTFVAMPFPDMMTALAQRRIDAASVVEPFVTIGVEQGFELVARPYIDAFTKGATYSLLFTAKPFADKNPELVRKFVAAVDRASTEAVHRPEEVAEVLVKYGKLDPEIASGMRLPGYGTVLDVGALEQTARVMRDLGFLTDRVDVEDVVLS